VTRRAASRDASPNVRARLLARIRRLYPTYDEVFQLGPLRVPFTRVADPRQVLDRIIDLHADRERRGEKLPAGQEVSLPYWAELWDSALGVSTFVATRGLDLAAPRPRTIDAPPPRVLDLGCGMGLTGVAAMELGARVTFADIETHALLFARLNAMRFPQDQSVIRRVNWQVDRLPEPFGLIIGADVLYERRQWEFLDAFWRHHLAPGGAVLLGEPGRHTSDEFAAWAASNGWSVGREGQPVPTRTQPIRLFVLR
jgi:predicted nicotinamide N-methyase